MINTVKDYEKLSEQYNKMLEERNSLIDDLPWYKAKDNRLERENEKLVDENTRLQNELYTMGLNQDEADDKIKGVEDEKERLKEIKQEKEQLEESFQYQLEKRLEYFNKYQELKQENKALRLQSDTYFEQWQQHKALNSEFSQHIGNKPSSSTYKYFRGKLNALEIREDE